MFAKGKIFIGKDFTVDKKLEEKLLPCVLDLISKLMISLLIDREMFEMPEKPLLCLFDLTLRSKQTF